MQTAERARMTPDEIRIDEVNRRLRTMQLTNSDLWRAIGIGFSKLGGELTEDMVSELSKLVGLSEVSSAAALLVRIGIILPYNVLLDNATFNYDNAPSEYTSGDPLTGLMKSDIESGDLTPCTQYYDKKTGVQKVSYAPSGFPMEPVRLDNLNLGIVAGLATTYVTKDSALGGFVGIQVADALAIPTLYSSRTPSLGAWAKDEAVQSSFNRLVVSQLKGSELIQVGAQSSQEARVVKRTA